MTTIFGYIEAENDDKECAKKGKKLFKKSLCAFIISLILAISLPTKKEWFTIYGIGGTIDYIENNDKAKQLPDKVIDAIDKYFDE